MANNPPEAIRTAFASIGRPLDQRYMSTLDQMIQEGRQQGQVQAATVAQLDLWTQRVLTAESAEGVVR